jgi:hypothetical protein
MLPGKSGGRNVKAILGERFDPEPLLLHEAESQLEKAKALDASHEKLRSFLAAVLCAHAALEGRANRLITHRPLFPPELPESEFHKVQYWSVLDKWNLISYLHKGEPMQRGHRPGQALKRLDTLRNAVSHYKSLWEVNPGQEWSAQFKQDDIARCIEAVTTVWIWDDPKFLLRLRSSPAALLAFARAADRNQIVRRELEFQRVFPGLGVPVAREYVND